MGISLNGGWHDTIIDRYSLPEISALSTAAHPGSIPQGVGGARLRLQAWRHRRRKNQQQGERARVKGYPAGRPRGSGDPFIGLRPSVRIHFAMNQNDLVAVQARRLLPLRHAVPLTKPDGRQSTRGNENMLPLKRTRQHAQNKGEAIRNADYSRKNPATHIKQSAQKNIQRPNPVPPNMQGGLRLFKSASRLRLKPLALGTRFLST